MQFFNQIFLLIANTESMWKQKSHFGMNSFNEVVYRVVAATVKYCSLKGNTSSGKITLHTGKWSKDFECWKELRILKVSPTNNNNKNMVCNGDLNNVKGFIYEEGRWTKGRNKEKSGEKKRDKWNISLSIVIRRCELLSLAQISQTAISRLNEQLNVSGGLRKSVRWLHQIKAVESFL